MRRQLQELQALNQADSLLTDLPLATSLCDYFDSHGTPNERMLAHYLLGRTHADRGESPEALQSYQDAIKTSGNDDALLARVYGQMSVVFYRQNLLSDHLNCLDSSIYYADKAGDSIASARSFIYKVNAYARMGLHDTVVVICDSGYHRLQNMGQEEIAARNAIEAIPSYLYLQQYEKAAYYLSAYEQKSGYFISQDQIESGREVYYYLKGLYYLKTGCLDSAEHFFRKELSTGADFNNQNGGAYGLALLYQQINMPDSAAKYALYSYDMNDSAYSQMATAEVLRMKSLYDYGVHQKIAQEQKERAEKERRKALFGLYCIIGLILLIAFVSIKWRKRQKNALKAYNNALETLEATQTELLHLRSRDVELSKLIDEKEQFVEKLLIDVDSLRRKAGKGSVNAIQDTEVYQNLHRKACSGKSLTDDEWSTINRLIIEKIPEFHQFVMSRRYALNMKEYQMCILLRLHIRPMDISHFLDVAPSYVTKMGRMVMTKLFGGDGTAKDLATELEAIG